MTQEEAYKQGFIDGITCYAHYRDGIQHVGTTGRTLDKALAEVEEHWNYTPPKNDTQDTTDKT